MTQPVKVGLLGYGTAGSVFHAPLVTAEPRFALAAVASSRADAVLQRYPQVKVHGTPEQLLADAAIELVVVATPDATHAPLARAALLAGKHVVVDKPLAMSADEARELIALARERGRLLCVFQNRRWDGDYMTVQQILRSGRLGEVRYAAFCWDRFRPQLKVGWREHTPEPWGALYNLGPHLVDQALQLFGRPEAVTGDVAQHRQGALSPDYFSITLHYGAARVLLSVSTLIADPRPRFALHGTRGSFVKYGVDPQEERLRAGMAADAPEIGEDLRDFHGLLTLDGAEPERIPTEAGEWTAFYAGIAAALIDGLPPPVDAADAVQALELIARARRSADQRCTLALDYAP